MKPSDIVSMNKLSEQQFADTINSAPDDMFFVIVSARFNKPIILQKYLMFIDKDKHAKELVHESISEGYLEIFKLLESNNVPLIFQEVSFRCLGMRGNKYEPLFHYLKSKNMMTKAFMDAFDKGVYQKSVQIIENMKLVDKLDKERQELNERRQQEFLNKERNEEYSQQEIRNEESVERRQELAEKRRRQEISNGKRKAVQ